MSNKNELIQKFKEKTVTQVAVQKILVEDLVGAIPEGEAEQLLLEALTVYRNGTEIVFKNAGSDLPTGGHYTYKDNIISIAKSGDEVDMAHTILFETYNAHHRENFRKADTSFKSPGQTPLDFGNTIAEIEGKTTEKYIKLVRIIQKSSNQLSPLSGHASHQLTACRDCQSTNDFVLLTKLTSHSSSARDHTAMMSPKVYAYEKVQTMGRLTASNKMKDIIRSKCGNSPALSRLNEFGYWFSDCWSKSTSKQHPKLWLEAGVQASKLFACDRPRIKVDPMALGFEATMVEMATRDAMDWSVPKFTFRN